MVLFVLAIFDNIMSETVQKYYPSILQSIHLIILYIFIQTLVDFPLALIDYYKDTEYMYNPLKKVLLNVVSTVFILVYGYKKMKIPFHKVFPLKFFNPLIVISVVIFFWGMHNILNEVNLWIEKVIPPPSWFWEMFDNIFESNGNWFGTFMKVAIIAPVVEELIFRGIILQGLRRNYSAFISVFMSALLFALFHLNPWQFPATFILGLLLGWITVMNNNILLAIIGHSINNLMVLLSINYWDEISTMQIFSSENNTVMLISAVVAIISLVLIYVFSMPWFRMNRK
ncbi:MAG: CPBP family intramembrane metalloprotease [Bacteroidales bacterium]|nr:CPBP family intramembrane metalloprotease [Bacteroidales bacterium]